MRGSVCTPLEEFMKSSLRQIRTFNGQARLFWSAKALFALAVIFLSALPASLWGQSQDGSGNGSAATPLIEATNLQVARKGHTATRLQDGRILIVGGENQSGPVAEGELFDAAAGTFSLGPALQTPRTEHIAILLPDGRVLIAGGRVDNQKLANTEIWDPNSNSSSSGPSLNQPRAGHSFTMLSDSRYLVAGGDDAGTAEIFDPASQSFIVLSSGLLTPRYSHSAVLLHNGKVLVAGGLDQNGQALATAELFDPETMSFSPVTNGMHSPRIHPILRVLPDGKVQVIGGDDEGTIEMFNADGNYFTGYAHLVTGTDSIGKLLRSPARAALLNLDPQKSGLQAALSGISSDASAAISEVTERTGYSLTTLSQVNDVVVAGGATNSAVATDSAYVIAGSQDATITVDKTDYVPGETVVITGSGFQPGETVDFLLHVEPLTSPDTTLTSSVADENGNFVNSTFVVRESDANVTLTLTATGESSGLVAQTIFTDIVLNTLNVIKTVNWGTSTKNTSQTFQICAQGPSYTTPNCKTIGYQGGTLTWNPSLSGNYTVTETNPGSSWTVGGSGAVVTVPNQGTGTGTITNTYNPSTGTLEVKKILNPSGDTGRFNLQIDGSTAGTGANVGNSGTTGAVALTVGAHVVSETAGTGVNLSDYIQAFSGDCDTTGDITLAAGDNKTCTITNTRKGSLQVTKTVDWIGSTPDPTAQFEICIQGPSYQTANCQSIGYLGGPLTWNNLIPGPYTVIETPPASSWTVTGSPSTVTVNAGTQATITVTNTLKPGTLIITKSVVTQPTGPAQTFSICIQGPSYQQNAPGSCQTIGIAGGQLAWNNIIPGQYAVSETDPGSAWIVSGIPTASVYVGPGTTRSDVTITNTLRIVGSLQLTKTASIQTYSAAGQAIGYTLSAINNTNVALTNVTITDPMFPSLNCVQASLQPAASLTCTGIYAIKQTDLDAGSLTNTATASGTFGGQTVSDTKSVSVNAIRNPALSLSKSANPMSYSGPQMAVDYTLIATNSGNVTLNGAVIADSKIGTLTCSPAQPAVLAPGAVLTCTGIYSTTQSDVDAGSVKNTATASANFNGTTVTASPASVTVTATQTPRLSLGKEATEATYNSTGDVLHYKLSATNNGNVTLSGVTITDPKLPVLSCSQPVSLAPGGTLTCTGVYTITQGDLDATQVKNVATAAGMFGATPVNSNPASVTVNGTASPHISLTKSSDSTGYNFAGDSIHYTLVATNDGNVTLSNAVISDPKLPGLACSPSQPSVLAPGASITCGGSYVTVQADVDAGSVTNTAFASGSFGNQTVSDSKTVRVTAVRNSHLSLSKTANPMTYNSVGAAIHYTLVARNDGNVTLASVSITDPKFASLGCTQPVSLSPGAALTCTGTYAISQADLNAGSVTNTASAAGMFGTTPVQANPASVTVTAAQSLNLSLSKTASPSNYSSIGAVITYSLTAVNNGNVSLTNVTIVDSKLPSLICTQPASLNPGAALTCTGSYTITQADLDAGSVTNSAGASGKYGSTSVNATPATVTIQAIQNPQLVITKSANPTTYSSQSDAIAYRYILKNTGNVTLSGPFSVSDNKTAVTCPTTPDILAPGASVSCSASYNITKADLVAGTVTNTAVGYAKFGNATVNSNQASATVAANIPPLSLSCVGGYVPAGKPYSYALPASGGVAPYTFSIISGALPSGLTLNSVTGVIAGTPTVAGLFNFTVQVVDYRGNSAGTIATGCGAILIYQESQFVIWGGNPTIPAGQPANVTVGLDYYFWGAQWSKQVLGGDWTSNASFKGYANQVDLVSQSWTTRPGNSSGPPDSVGSYISVIVATQTTKQGSDISGNIAETAILKVDDPSAYGPNPGHSGSGILVAIIR